MDKVTSDDKKNLFSRSMEILETSFVIDSSVVIKWTSAEDEKGVASSLKIYEQLQFGEIKLYAPTFLLIEIANILFWKKKITKNEIESFIRKVSQSGIIFLDLSIDIVPGVLTLMTERKVSSYDAIFLQLAKLKNCKLISDDRELTKIGELVVGLDKI